MSSVRSARGVTPRKSKGATAIASKNDAGASSKRPRIAVRSANGGSLPISNIPSHDEEVGKPLVEENEEEKFRKVLSRQGTLSLTEATAVLDSVTKLVKNNPLVSGSWRLLLDVIKLKELAGRKMGGHMEKNLIDALTAVCHSSDSLDAEVKDVCQFAWRSASDNLAFRPRLEVLRDILVRTPRSELMWLLLSEFKQATDVDAVRKVFDVVCDERVLSTLLTLAVSDSTNQPAPKVSELAEEILFSCIFKNDEADDICAACTNPRANTDLNKKKGTNQNNWRAIFWKVLDDCIRKRLVPLDRSLGLVCLLHRRKHPTTTTVFWFELLFLLLEISKSAESDSQVMISVALIDLLEQGLLWYMPTVSEDEATLGRWIDTLVRERKTNGGVLVKVIERAIQLDYRVVEPHFASLVRGDSFASPDNEQDVCEWRILMVVAVLKSFTETRRVPQWVQFISNLGFTQSWFGENLSLVKNCRRSAVEMFRTKVTEHQTAHIWQAFFFSDESSSSSLLPVFNDELLLCAFEAFIFCVRVGSDMHGGGNESSGNDAMKQIHENAKRAQGMVIERIRSESKENKAGGKMTMWLNLIRLFRSSTLLMRLSATEESTSGHDEVFKGFRRMKKHVSSEVQVEMAVASLDCLLSTSFDDGDKVINWTATVLFENHLGAELLKALSTRPSLLNLLDEDNRIHIWERICVDRDESFVQLLGKAYFFEINALSESFVAFVALKVLSLKEKSEKRERMNAVLRLMAQFPRGFISEADVETIIVEKCFGEADRCASCDVLCEVLLAVSGNGTESLVGKAFGHSVKELSSFASDLIRCPSIDDTQVMRLMRAFVAVIEDPNDLLHLLDEWLKRSEEEEETRLTQSAVVGIVLGAADRLAGDEINGTGRQDLLWTTSQTMIERISSKVFGGSNTNKRQSSSMWCLIGSMLQLAKASAQLKSNSPARLNTLSLNIPIGQLLHDTRMMLTEPQQQADGRSRKDAEDLISSLCDTFHLFEPEMPQDATTFLVALAVHIQCNNPTSSSSVQQTPLHRYLNHCEPQHVATLVDSALADAWSSSSSLPEGTFKSRMAGQVLRSILEFRVRKHWLQVIIRRASPLWTSLGHLTQIPEAEEDAWYALIAFVNADVLRETLTEKDVGVMLTATTSSTSVLKAKFMQLLSELSPKIVSKNVSAAFAMSIGALERGLLFSTSSSKESSKIKVAAALELVRLCESLKDNAAVFKHHAVPLLADHITLMYMKGVPSEDLRRPLELMAFYLFDLCGDHEVQQLHAVLGGGAGGARREVLRRLVEDHQRSHVFKGKV